MRIGFIPIDNRPVCYSLPINIAELDKSIELFIPPRELLGGLTIPADNIQILNWLKNTENLDALVVALDTVAYGGLVQSRRAALSLEDIKSVLNEFKTVLVSKKTKVFAFSSIMRISDNNFNIEEKEYWAKYGKKLFKYSYDSDKCGKLMIAEDYEIPQAVVDDYLITRNRNFEINKLYLEWQKEGLFDTLIFSKDDCAEYGLNVSEANQLETLGAKIQTGADEIPLSLLSKTLDKSIKIYPVYTSDNDKSLISNYEDISVEQSVKNQIELAGMHLTQDYNCADLVLIVNNFEHHQGEIVMKTDTKRFDGLIPKYDKPCLYADVRFANGADNNFTEQIFNRPYHINSFYGYSAWNTTANTLGSLLCVAKFKFNALKYDDNAFKKLQLIRFLDDWAYQANVRQQLNDLTEITELMKNYKNKITDFLQIDKNVQCKYSYPWERLFEIEVCCEL